jgi:hypothetical protein
MAFAELKDAKVPADRVKGFFGRNVRALDCPWRERPRFRPAFEM